MPPDEEPPYSGPYVTVRADGPTFAVAIEPPLHSGEGHPRTFASKHDAWGAARELWTVNRLPLRDFTVSETARAEITKKSSRTDSL